MKQLHLDDSRRTPEVPRKPPRKLAGEGKRKESETTPELIAYLERVGCFVWRNNSGVMKKGRHYVRYGFVGSSDIIGMMPDGRFLAVENKSNGEPIKPAQERFLEQVRARGGVGIVVTGLDDMIGKIEGARG